MPIELAERLSDLVLLWEERRNLGEPISAEELCRDTPELLAPLRERIAKLERMNALLSPVSAVAMSPEIESTREVGTRDHRCDL